MMDFFLLCILEHRPDRLGYSGGYQKKMHLFSAFIEPTASLTATASGWSASARTSLPR